MLAQEEFAKAFLLHLIQEGAIPWSSEVRRSVQDHACKQLLGLVMEFLNPPFEDLFDRIDRAFKVEKFPPDIADALNIYCHEKIGRWKSQTWTWAEEPDYDTTAKKVGNGHIDKHKQDALYVRLANSGEIASLPSRVTREMVANELEKADRLNELVVNLKKGLVVMQLDFERMKNVLKLIFTDDLVECQIAGLDPEKIKSLLKGLKPDEKDAS